MKHNQMTPAQASTTRQIMDNPHTLDTARQAFMHATLSENQAELVHYATHAKKPLLYQLALITPDADAEVLRGLAISPHTDPSVLMLLSLNTDPSVQAVVAENPRTPTEALWELSYVPALGEGDAMADAEFIAIVARNNLNRRLSIWEAGQATEPGTGTPVNR